ncbi:surface antigen [Plasmodium falciparum UGT5.1]|uniref:Surface antigen n=1 Tax=Plasmodium falciparum UGT5.1 TaxID=1237627 RepID=W7JML4_PLAFA|nr:surface antigen [Plasmodium falciparum UGT5.1]
MKVHYINILLFALQLNIFVTLYHVRNKNKPYITHNTTNTKRLKTHRTLCECDIYASNYDNDPEMKALMENFILQTSQRFREYDERIQEKRRKCKEKCDKEMQQIILKDKVEKELTEKLVALQTHIDLDDLPECTCKKSVAEKTENFCLKCGYGLGSVVPSVGIFGALAVNELTKAATAVAVQKGIDEGIKVAIFELNDIFRLESLLGAEKVLQIITPSNFNNPTLLGQLVQRTYNTMCLTTEESYTNNLLCFLKSSLKTEVKVTTFIAQNARNAAIKAGEEAAKITSQEITAVNMASYNLYTSIAYSVVAILVIILVMVIIYLILHYRRKKKMKKKLQYIKLLKE